MSAAHETKDALHCHHCGREVSGTVHTRASYRVDYYALHTGDTEPVTLKTEDAEGTVTFLRLVRVRNIVTCTDCYRQARVRMEREQLFRPELAEASQELS